jgi:hypothetical protein
MNRIDLQTLATFNSEVARGILHTEEWKKRMGELQKQFDAEMISSSQHRRFRLADPFEIDASE